MHLMMLDTYDTSLAIFSKERPSIDIAYYCLGALPRETNHIEITHFSYLLFGVVL